MPNRGVAAASGQVLTKMDDDDHYGPHYLSDQLHALAYSGADVVGKQAHYMHLETANAAILRFAAREHRFTDFVMGPTIMARREVFTDHPFLDVTVGEDTGFCALRMPPVGSFTRRTASTTSRSVPVTGTRGRWRTQNCWHPET